MCQKSQKSVKSFLLKKAIQKHNQHAHILNRFGSPETKPFPKVPLKKIPASIGLALGPNYFHILLRYTLIKSPKEKIKLGPSPREMDSTTDVKKTSEYLSLSRDLVEPLWVPINPQNVPRIHVNFPRKFHPGNIGHAIRLDVLFRVLRCSKASFNALTSSFITFKNFKLLKY